MRINAQISDLIQFASNNGYPVYVGLHEVTVDAFADGKFSIFWSAGFTKVLIYRLLKYKTTAINGSDEFKSLLYRRLHGSPEVEELQPDIIPDVEDEDNYHEYL